MQYLLDTNVLSESMRLRPETKVVAWLGSVPPNSCYVSVLTLGEIRAGAEAHADATRRRKLTTWLEATLIPWFANRVVPVDAEIADRWGRLSAAASRPLPTIDSLLAAAAMSRGLVLVTRDHGFQDFQGLETFNPWQTK
jgi:toxin FitB